MATSDSDSSDIDDLNWSYSKRKINSILLSSSKNDSVPEKNELSSEVHEKFEELKKKSEAIKLQSSRCMRRIEMRRSKKLIKTALKDPEIRQLVTNSKSQPGSEKSSELKEKEEWKEIKPFLNINSRFQAVSHGALGPKTEMQSIIEDAIEEGDIEKAELLSDTLANKEFAGQICKAFAAKRCHEELEKEKALNKEKQKKKVRWTFEAKEKWEMKGNM
ncbi:hypothetical protein JTE90_001479 [Oedothorax gibbosus]|uniref:Protein FAM204A n=1 Tax=Oedothorax gibbosus TaxID=931172 RepID=A0AAV6UCP8_9ARAC|nr:hypothetical protein JTE90_001479 [Oedothorax gibbosus]